MGFGCCQESALEKTRRKAMRVLEGERCKDPHDQKDGETETYVSIHLFIYTRERERERERNGQAESIRIGKQGSSRGKRMNESCERERERERDLPRQTQDELSPAGKYLRARFPTQGGQQ